MQAYFFNDGSINNNNFNCSARFGGSLYFKLKDIFYFRKLGKPE